LFTITTLTLWIVLKKIFKIITSFLKYFNNTTNEFSGKKRVADFRNLMSLFKAIA